MAATPPTDRIVQLAAWRRLWTVLLSSPARGDTAAGPDGDPGAAAVEVRDG